MSYHRLPLWQSPLGEPKKGADLYEPPLDTHDETQFENPQFQHYEQTSNIQLFFDLFFVANLTSFTANHDINSLNRLGSYFGFFCILWFTWCQVTLYDVRFATDSVIERIAHACHFGVMVGLATVGPQFDPSDTYWDTLQQLSLILMASRITLLFQYSFTLFFTWRYKNTRLPLALVISSLAIAASLYLGLSFAFSTETDENAYIAWYVVAVFEVGSNIAIAGKWDILSFKETHLVERMTCLTLIMLGEGVIGLVSQIATIENYDFVFNASTIGTIISSLLIIYFIYQLYFDNVPKEDFGTIQQQIWAFLHFPFHLALVLLMEGINQFVIWRHAIEIFGSIITQISNLPSDTPNTDYSDVLSATVDSTLNNFWPLTNDTAIIDEINSALSNLYNTTGNVTESEYINASDTIVVELFKIVLEDFGFEPPGEVSGLDAPDQIQAYYNVFTLIFGYFFISAGLVLIGIGVLSWLSVLKEKRTWRRNIGIASDLLLGLGLALLATMLMTNDSDNLGSSPWTLPLLVFILFIALILNHVPRSSESR